MRALDSLVTLVTERVAVAKDPAKPYVGLEHIPSGGASLKQVGSSSDSISTNGVFASGDILFGKLRPRLRKSVRATQAGYCSTDILVLRTLPGVDPCFASFVTQSDEIFRRAIQTEEGTKMPRCSWRDLRTAVVFAPASVGEQQRIAAILTSLDTAIEATEALIEKHQQIKAGLMNDLFTRGVSNDGRLRPTSSDAPHLFRMVGDQCIPVDWQFEKLDELATRGSGHTPNKNVPEYWNGGIKWISLADSHRLDALYISNTELSISHRGIQNSSAVLHPSGIVVLSRDAGVGKSAITTEPMAVSQHFMCWRCDHRLDNHFLYYWLQFKKRMFESIAMGSTILTIGLPYFKKLRIACPVDLEEQRAIADRLKSADEYLFAMRDQLEKLRAKKQGLMQDLLTGKVPVRAD